MPATGRVASAGAAKPPDRTAEPGGKDDPRELDFYMALREHDYPDIAIWYLELAKSDPRAPARIRENWDVEMAHCLIAQAGAIDEPAEYDRLMALARMHIDKSLKEQPGNPEATAVRARYTSFHFRQAVQLIAEAASPPGRQGSCPATAGRQGQAPRQAQRHDEHGRAVPKGSGAPCN